MVGEAAGELVFLYAVAFAFTAIVGLLAFVGLLRKAFLWLGEGWEPAALGGPLDDLIEL